MANQQESITSAVLVPAGQAIVTGCFIGLAAGSIAWAVDAGNPAALGMASGASVAALAWFGLRSSWERRLESVLGVASQPAAPAAALAYNQVIKVEVLSEGGRAGDFLDLPGGSENLIKFACGLQDGRGLTVATWTGSAGVYTRGQFEALRHELLKRGLVRWRNPHDPKGGAELTARGRATFRGIASLANQAPTEAAALASIENRPATAGAHMNTQKG